MQGIVGITRRGQKEVGASGGTFFSMGGVAQNKVSYMLKALKDGFLDSNRIFGENPKIYSFKNSHKQN